MKFKFAALKKFAEQLLYGYRSENDPMLNKLKRIRDLIHRDQWDAAKQALNATDLRTTMENRKDWFKAVPLLKDIYDKYKNIMALVEQNKKDNAIRLITDIIVNFEKPEAIRAINTLQMQKTPEN